MTNLLGGGKTMKRNLSFFLFFVLSIPLWASPALVAEKSPYKIGVNL